MGLFFLAKEGKPLHSMPYRQRPFFFIFLCLALQRPSQQPEVPRLHPRCPGDAAGDSPVLGDNALGAQRLGPHFKTPLIGLGMQQKQSGNFWLFSVHLAPPV